MEDLLICPRNICQSSVAPPLVPLSGSAGSDRCHIIYLKDYKFEVSDKFVCKVNRFNPEHLHFLCTWIWLIAGKLLGSGGNAAALECTAQLRFSHPYEIPLQRWVEASWKRTMWKTPGICINSCLKAQGGLAAHCLEKALPRTHLLLSPFISLSFYLSVLLKAAEQTWWLSCAGF